VTGDAFSFVFLASPGSFHSPI